MDILFPKAEYPAERLPAPDGVEAACCQCEGDRDEQQDAIGLALTGSGLLAAVADGMGALARGAAAAQQAVDSLELEAGEIFAGGCSYAAMKAALERVNRDVYRMIDVCGVMGMSGTTICAAVASGRDMRLVWCGDSRAYLWRAGKLARLTEDHVYGRILREMVAEGVIGEAEARAHPKRGYLTGYVGVRALEDFSVRAEPLGMERGDGLLLCTDGLYKCLDETEMRRCMARGAMAAAEALIAGVARKRLRGQDNATALVLKWTK